MKRSESSKTNGNANNNGNGGAQQPPLLKRCSTNKMGNMLPMECEHEAMMVDVNEDDMFKVRIVKYNTIISPVH